MLGIILIYFLGRYFYDLADSYGKNKWGFAILGVVSYYTTTIIVGFVLVLAIELSSPGTIDTINDFLLDLILMPLGLLGTWLLYKYLEKRFANELNKSTDGINSDILDDDFL
ncbi:MAG: hypothetical protein AAF502_07385 [Bacteroidota bacterium]